jgi:RNA polymerase sigma-70 factor (ECF subfamily)
VLYDRYHERAFRIAAVCRDYGRAEEAVQETFTSIWKTRASYHSQVGTVAPWLLTVARYRAIDIARRNGRDAAHQTTDEPLQTVSAPSDVPQQAAAHAQTRRVLSLLAQLPDTQREVITLAFYGELSHTEIAEHLDLPPGTIKGACASGYNDSAPTSNDEPSPPPSSRPLRSVPAGATPPGWATPGRAPDARSLGRVGHGRHA